MRESEFKPILDRDKHEGDVRQYFSKHIDLLVDLANYGSNLIPRVYDSSNKKLEDIVIIGVLLKQVVSMIDAVEILVSKGAVDPANLQARAAFESSLYIDWILMNQSEKKAKYYYISNLRNQRLWALRFKAGTTEREVFSKTFQYLERYLEATDLENIEKQAEEGLSKIDSLLTKNGWKEISLEFERRKDKKTGAESYWYKMLGVASIRQLAEQVGRLGEYNLFYARSSEVVHATSYSDHIRFGKGTISFEPIRQLKDMHNLLRFITSVAISSYVSVLKHYRRGELSHFARKYMRDWRDAFLNIPAVSYTDQTNNP